MSHMIHFLDTSAMNSCRKAVAPVTFQSFNELAAGEGDVPVIVADVAADQPAYYGGQVIVKGCKDVQLTLQYLDGDDCDPCTSPDTLTLAPVTLTVPANSAFPLPDGFWQDAEFVLLDDAGNPVQLSGNQTESVRFYSTYTPDCPDCAVMAI